MEYLQKHTGVRQYLTNLSAVSRVQQCRMTSGEKKEILAVLDGVRRDLDELSQVVERLVIAVHGDEELNLTPVRHDVDDLKLTISRAKWFMAGLTASNLATLSGGIAWVATVLENLA